MADSRLKAIITQLADLSSRTNYVLDYARQMAGNIGAGDSLEIPQMADLTVASAIDSGSAPQDVTIQDATLSVLRLTVDREPVIFTQIPQLDRFQTLGGSYFEELAKMHYVQLRNSMDTDFVTYLTKTICWATGSSATYHVNPAGDSLSVDDIVNARASLLSQPGSDPSRLAFFIHPFAEASIAKIAGFIPNYGMAEQGALGIPRIGSVYGVPCYASQSILRNQTIAVTVAPVTAAGAVSTTFTVAAGHGVVPGMTFVSSGFDADENGSMTVTSSTATTIVASHTATTAGTSSIATGTLTFSSALNLMCDLGHVYAAQQKMPSARIVPRHNRTSDVLQMSALWGQLARAGRVYCVSSPGSSA